jgi:hypothetical protein
MIHDPWELGARLFMLVRHIALLIKEPKSEHLVPIE